MMQNWKRHCLVVSRLTWEIWRILQRALKILKNLYFNGLFLMKIYNVWAEKFQRSYVRWPWRLMQNFKENWLVLSKMTWRIWKIFVHSLRNSNFSLESKIVALNKNKTSNKPEWPAAVWKFYFILEINE